VAELRARLEAAGALGGAPVVTSCGSGVTAAILTLALASLGVPSRLYDGSWAEWGAEGGGPVVVG
jgi:thiosulfate/3-mercaptopyruvate sulfurtransferase